MTTSGSSGRKGLFVYDRAGWRGVRASSCAAATGSASARGSARCGWRCRRRRADAHEPARRASLDVGVHRVLVAVGDAAGPRARERR